MSRLFLFLATLTLVACGGGGGGGGGDNAALDAGVFVGEYTLVWMQSDATLDTQVSWGTATADGVSQVAVDGSQNSNSTVSGPGSSTFDYTVAPDGVLTMQLSGSDVFRGHLRADGHIAVLVSVTTTSQGILVLLKPEGTYNVADLAGDYGVSSFTVNPSPGNPYTVMGSVNVTPSGVINGPAVVNVNGTIIPGAVISGALGVASDGTGSYDVGGVSWTGAWSPDATLGLFAGDTTGGPLGPPAIWSYVRRGTGLSNTTLAGEYAIVGLEYAPTAPAFNAFEGTLTADGVGGMTVAGTTNTGLALDPLNGTASYTVASTGEVIVNRGALTEDVVGTVSPDGRYFVAAGGSAANSTLTFWIAFRK
ncbi:MAG: hypothetical protein QNJ98_08605 [Planctomycetota bacterium]|nr:hypothetical protein [Planctomycetota bacterium]